jgi:hypothetical protein
VVLVGHALGFAFVTRLFAAPHKGIVANFVKRPSHRYAVTPLYRRRLYS